MRILAEFIMRGRVQAITVVALASAVPMMFWLSAAAVSLVLLRRGLNDALSVIVWALLPALMWAYFADPRPLLGLVGAIALAYTLRATGSWSRVLLVSLLIGVFCTWVLGVVFAQPLTDLAAELNALMPKVLSELYEQLTTEQRLQLQSLIVPVLTGLMAAVLQILCVLSVLIARYWQAVLYNPGGFALEFQGLRLPVGVVFPLVFGMLFAPSLGIQAAVLTPVCSVPLMIAGLAVVHGLVARYRSGNFWLIGLYIGIVLFTQVVYPFLVVLTIVDSVFDFRGLRTQDNDSDSANGER
ncbi:hypothetical protein FXF61_10145 [Pseudomonas sp. C27(2019)]|uniref:hypothetical protein n=1 Tax=Pseudomonas sp. C27(2019) TaxID=2604941 RepID=UPI0012468E49|nr:hypothetical protein [Pseudomonas sp. C27(2019)]QEY59495.1 hypothetical protein FXF61_10145 [Pseudomonas sp. C27(2019)]